MFRANRGASISGEVCIRCRRVARRLPRRARSSANSAAMRTYCSGSGGDQFRQAEIHQLAQTGSPHDRLPHQGHDRHAHPKRVQAGRVPVVGNRIQSDVDAVVSTASTAAWAGGRRTSRDRGQRLPRPAGPASCWRCVPSPARSVSRERSTALRTRAQIFRTSGLTLQKLLRQPNVIYPFSAAGRALTAGSLSSGS